MEYYDERTYFNEELSIERNKAKAFFYIGRQLERLANFKKKEVA